MALSAPTVTEKLRRSYFWRCRMGLQECCLEGVNAVLIVVVLIAKLNCRPE